MIKIDNLPQSAPFSCPVAVGGILGFAMAVSPSAVVWHQQKGSFPYVEGLYSVAASQFISPIASATISAVSFWIVR